MALRTILCCSIILVALQVVVPETTGQITEQSQASIQLELITQSESKKKSLLEWFKQLVDNHRTAANVSIAFGVVFSTALIIYSVIRLLYGNSQITADVFKSPIVPSVRTPKFDQNIRITTAIIVCCVLLFVGIAFYVYYEFFNNHSRSSSETERKNEPCHSKQRNFQTCKNSLIEAIKTWIINCIPTCLVSSCLLASLKLSCNHNLWCNVCEMQVFSVCVGVLCLRMNKLRNVWDRVNSSPSVHRVPRLQALMPSSLATTGCTRNMVVVSVTETGNWAYTLAWNIFDCHRRRTKSIKEVVLVDGENRTLTYLATRVRLANWNDSISWSVKVSRNGVE